MVRQGSQLIPSTPAPPAAAPQSQAATSKYSADVIQHLFDKAAYFNLYSSPIRQTSGPRVVVRRSDREIGFQIRERLHRFEIVMEPPDVEFGLRASNVVGEEIGNFESRWLFCPDDFEALPHTEPPPTSFDPMKRQRFVMLDGDCLLGNNGDGFCGFGTGRTFPTRGEENLAAAVGIVMEGRGRLKGLVGTYTYCGTLNSEEGFRGSLMLRVMDPDGAIASTASLPAIDGQGWPERGITYLMFRGQATETDKVAPFTGVGGQPEGLNVAQQLRLFQTEASGRGPQGLQSTTHVGQTIGEIDAQIIFNPAAPGGNALDPIPYTAFDEYKFTDRCGQSIGSFFIDEGEGRTFNLQLPGAPGQPAIRFGGFGPILRATGSLAGAAGLMTDNSVVSFIPHVSASVYVIRVDDPRGKYRAHAGGGER